MERIAFSLDSTHQRLTPLRMTQPLENACTLRALGDSPAYLWLIYMRADVDIRKHWQQAITP